MELGNPTDGAAAVEAVRVRIGWGEYPLHDVLLYPPRRFTVGEGHTDLVLPASVVGPSVLEVVEGNGRVALGQPLERGGAVERRLGAFLVTVSAEARPERWPRPHASGRMAVFVTGVAALCLGVLALLARAPRPSEAETLRAQIWMMQTYLNTAAEREQEQREAERVANEEADVREGGGCCFRDRSEVDADFVAEWKNRRLPYRRGYDLYSRHRENRASAAAFASGAAVAPTRGRPRPDAPTVARRGGATAEVGALPQAAVAPRSTLELDASSPFASLTARALPGGVPAAPHSVEIAEFLAGLDFADSDALDAQGEHPLRVHLEAAPSPFAAGRHLLWVGLEGERLGSASRDPMHLTMLVDTTQSMQSNSSLALAQEGLRSLAAGLSERDTMAICSWYGRVHELLPPTPASDGPRILEAIDSLGKERGATVGSGMDTAIRLAYRLAGTAQARGESSQVFLLSDGRINLDNTESDALLEAVRLLAGKGITISTIAIGDGHLDTNVMRSVASAGGGGRVRVETPDEVRRVFARLAAGGGRVVAEDVRVEVEFNPAAVREYRLLGEDASAVAGRVPGDVTAAGSRAAAGANLWAGRSATMLFELLLRDSPASPVTLHVQYQLPSGGRQVRGTAKLRPERRAATFASASASFRSATAAAALAEVLRGNPAASGWSLEQLEAIARDSAGDNGARHELVDTLQRLRAVAPDVAMRAAEVRAQAAAYEAREPARAEEYAALVREFGGED
jgi:Ca-activated chloride channel family protein